MDPRHGTMVSRRCRCAQKRSGARATTRGGASSDSSDFGLTCADNVSSQLPIVSYVPVPLDAPPGTRSFIAHDMRVSSRHPLRHAVFNLIRLAGDVVPPSSKPNQSENGQNYLLTSRTLFITHEPCIACSMALLHSRVKEVKTTVIVISAAYNIFLRIGCLSACNATNRRMWKYNVCARTKGGKSPIQAVEMARDACSC